ncbi:hypothetical protein HOLleu_19495 [Holothuria leucospilota]|uniref:Uncharacterized protein n=1 Tax=Holothuria leucospilota TaxID=206669 RepID=A0A9Q1H7U7_HOLLE|nr:hypothetical protein HOLleu_19495 [Holothuria leucospilota]
MLKLNRNLNILVQKNVLENMAGTRLPTGEQSGEHPEERSPNGFLHIPEVQCNIALQDACDDGTLLKQALESRKNRDATNEKWRKALLEIWKLTNDQGKNEENMDLGQIEDRKKRQVSMLLSEVEAANNLYQGCLDNFRELYSTTEASVGCSPLSSTELDIKVGGSEVKTFADATKGYIQEHFMPINQVHRVPPFLFFSDDYKRGAKRDGKRSRQHSGNCKIGQLSYYSDHCLPTHPQLEQLEQTHTHVQNIKDKRRGIEAVDLVGDILIKCHQHLPGGMFVITNLKHQKYLENFIKSTKNKATPSADQGLKVMVTAEDGDHDIIVIHRKIGVILIQVKGCTPSSAKKTKKGMIQLALEQVMKDKFVFYESNRDLDFVLDGKLPVYGFAAVPFLKKLEVESLGVCKNHSSMILTECDLKYLHEWLVVRVNVPVRDEDFALTEDEYMLLCGRYAGLLSEVPMRTFKEGNEKLGEKIEYLFLTPDQMALVHESRERFMCVCGDYGTGKSLVLVEKAKKLVEEDDSSIALVISCSDIDNYWLCKLNRPYKAADQLKHFLTFRKNGNISERIRVLQFGDVLQDVSDGNCEEMTKITPESFHRIILSYVNKQKVAGKCHIFLDEVPAHAFVEDFGCTEGGSNWDNINFELPEGFFCWMSVCPHSYMMRKEDHPSRIIPFLPKAFKWHYLKLIMRIPIRVCDLVKGIEDHIGQGHLIHSCIGHTFKGPKPLLVTLPKCPCPKGDIIPCSCSSARLEASLEKIREHFDFTALPVVVIMFMFHSGDYILPLYQQFQDILQNAFSNFDVKLEWNTMYGSKTKNSKEGKVTIAVVDQHTFIGCESRNVMCIDMFGMHQWFTHESEWFHLIVNRCTAQYIQVNWPEVEARTQWLAFLQGYELYCKDITSQGDVMTRLKIAKESKGLCVKFLREKNLFEEILVN